MNILLKNPYFRLISHPDDSPDETIRKTLIATVCPLVGFIGICYSAVQTGESFSMLRAAPIFNIIFTLCVILWVGVRKRVGLSAMAFFVAGYWLLIVMLDFSSASLGFSRAWPLFVCVVDVIIVCRLPVGFSVAMCISTCTWLVIITAESVWRFGLLDLTFTESQQREYSECSNMPCSKPLGLSSAMMLTELFVFLIDFQITRGFAHRASSESDAVRASISITQNIASALAAFDLDASESILNNHSATLPTELSISLRNVLDNLRSYQPFLPQSLFQTNPETIIHNSPPGIECGTHTAAIVLTDIMSSTVTWEKCPTTMGDALRMHNRVMREHIYSNQGYEVKTIGDAFMVAFPTSSSACCFGLGVQEALVQVAWPSEILHLPHCCKDLSRGWNGLRVRIGVHKGTVDVDMNHVAGRWDYYGTTVNMAARIESVCIPGSVAVSSEVYNDAFASEHMPSMLETVVAESRTFTLKGVEKPCLVYMLLPETLKQRVKEEDEDEEYQSTLSQQDYMTTVSMLSLRQEAGASRGTVAKIELRTGLEFFPEETSEITGIGMRLEKVFRFLEQCSGIVACVLGGGIVAGWNTSKPCLLHFETSLDFVGLLDHALGRCDESWTVGLITGSVVSGIVGQKKQRFVTVSGLPVQLLTYIVPLAHELGMRGLYATVPNTALRTMQGVLRPIATFFLSHSREPFTTYQLATHQIRHYLKFGTREKPDPLWGPDYWDAYTTGDFTPQQLGDGTISKVASLKEQGNKVLSVG